MLKVSDICFSYRGNKVLDGFGLELKCGECVVIAGANGCGKSTALALIAGILRPDSGTVEVGGSIGYVPQKTGLMEDMTSADNLRFFCALAGKPMPETPPFGVAEFYKKRVGKLSGGMKKRLSIACALAAQPDILLLDEPCEALDAGARSELVWLLASLKAAGKSILYVAHDPDEFFPIFDRLVVIKSGRAEVYQRGELLGTGSSEEQFSQLQRKFALLYK